MLKAEQYLQTSIGLLQNVLARESETIVQAAEMIAETICGGGMLFVFGTGHSHMFAEELFYRAGGLANVYPILEEPLMLHNGAAKSSDVERLAGYAETILQHTPVRSGDTMVIASNSGRNAAVIEMALACKARGVRVIALTSLAHSKAEPSRHECGKKLYELADVVLDNGGCVGDASVYFEALGRNVGATSTVVGCAILEAVVCETVDRLLRRGWTPDVYSSSNVSGGDAINAAYVEKYKPVIKPL